MKNIKTFAISLFLLAQTFAFAIEVPLKGKVSYLRPVDPTTREMYAGGPFYQLEADFQAYKALYGWVNIGYFSKSGHILGTTSPTTWQMIPLGIGLKGLFPIFAFTKLYFGAGLSPTYIHVSNDSPYFPAKESKLSCGGTFLSGMLFEFKQNMFVDLFLDYTILRTKGSPSYTSLVYSQEALLDNINIGAGCGVNF